MVTYKSNLTGHEETVEALPETKEYDAYLYEMMLWEEECRRIREDLALSETDFSYDYAILGWREMGSEEWKSEAPDDWQPSGAYGRHGVELSDIRRLTFIFDELLDTADKMDAVREVAFPVGDADTSPITEEEVRAVLDTFPVGSTGDGGSVGGTARAGRGGHQDVGVRKRDADGRRKRPLTRWLVRMLEGS
jgi:hypothetical protein